MKSELRFDTANITGEITRTPEGFIRAKAIVTRTGVFNYRNSDGSPRRELRIPEEVFNADSLQSMKMIPITNSHPTEWVTSANAGTLGVGMTGETVERIDDNFVSCSLTITRADAIAAIDAGRRQLSLGYSLELDPTPGIFDGENYDCIQRNIRYNHLAIVDKARAGDAASLRLDGCDFTAENTSEGKNMKPITINGITYNVDDAVADAFGAETAKANAAAAAASDSQKNADAAEAKADEAKAEVERVKAANADSEIEKRVDARFTLLNISAKHLDAAAFDAVKSKSDREIRVAVIAAKNPGFNADGRSDDYIIARFDGVTETPVKPKPEDDSANKQEKSFSKNADGTEKRDDEFDIAAAYARQNETMKNPNKA